MITNKKTSLLLLTSLISLTGCCTILHGTRQSVSITSNPTNATVWVDNNFVGKTPLIVEMKRKDNHFVRIELDGYLPFQATFTKELNAWVFGNILFGGFIGLAVDAISGGIYVLTPEQIQCEMRADHLASKRSNESFIAVVLQPDPSWQKIGELERVN